MTRIVVYGSSGHSLTVAQALTCGSPSQPACEVAAYIDDLRGSLRHNVDGVPIVSFDEWKDKFADLGCIIAVGDPKTKRRLAEKVVAAGGYFQCLYDKRDRRFPHVSIGAGTAIFPIVYIATNTTIGDHVQIMPMCCIGHDVTIADYVTLAPSCTVSGYVIIEEAVYIGAGVTIVNGRPERPLVIGAGAKIAAGAVVTKAVPQRASVAGNPARGLRDLVLARKASGISGIRE